MKVKNISKEPVEIMWLGNIHLVQPGEIYETSWDVAHLLTANSKCVVVVDKVKEEPKIVKKIKKAKKKIFKRK